MFYTWLSIVVALAILEIATVNLVSIWFVVSGVLAMITSLFTDNIIIQASIFIIFGIIFMLLTKKIVKKIIPNKEKTNLDRIIGMTGIVISKITKNKPGEVKVDGKHWSATSKVPLEKGEVVKILKMNGVKLEVKRWEE